MELVEVALRDPVIPANDQRKDAVAFAGHIVHIAHILRGNGLNK